MITVNHFLVVSGILFSIGLFGALGKRNAVAVLMCIELMFNAINIALVAFSHYVTPVSLNGQVFVVLILAVAAAEAAVGLAILFAIYRRRETIDAERISLMRW